MSKEIWLPVEGFECRYNVSNTGKVMSSDMLINNRHGGKSKKKGRLLAFNNDGNGYPIVKLCIDGVEKTVKIHRLVAIAFIENPDNKLQVNHINGNKEDNRVENLEWVTNQENIIHAYSNGLINLKRGEKHHQSKLKKNQVIEIKERLNYGEILRTIALDFNVSTSTISYIKHGKIWSHV